MLDTFKRQVDYLRVSVTDRCNLRCVYCMPEEGVVLKKHSDIISYENILRIIEAGTRAGIKKIRITGGEPLLKRNLEYLLKEIKKITDIQELTLTTNGVLLDQMAELLKESGLDRLNISLDTLSAERYQKITRIGRIEWVLKGIDAAIRAGFLNTKINMVVLPHINLDEVDSMKDFCRRKGLALQRINHYTLKNLNSIDRIYEAERPLPCHLCNRIRLTADGKLKPCLFSDLEVSVDFDDLDGSIKKAILGKPEQGTSCHGKEIWQIGG